MSILTPAKKKYFLRSSQDATTTATTTATRDTTGQERFGEADDVGE
jgi:hypothetical protein